MKNKLISIIMIICVSLCLPITSYAVSGKGTEANPFRITTYDELMLLADFPEAYFELENDIEITGSWEAVAEFSGTFDGKGHTITVSSYSNNPQGFFNNLTGTVKNLILNANSLTFSKVYKGGLLAGECSGTIKNCKIVGSATLTLTYGISTSYYGSICGYLKESGKIEYCTSALDKFVAAITKSSSSIYPGGICGKSDGTISHCMNVNSSVQLHGYNYYGYVYYGGIISDNNGLVNNCLNLETVDETEYSSYIEYGGIAESNTGSIECCYAGSNILSSISYKYGISENTSTTVSNVTKTGTMTNCFYDKVLLGNSSTSYGIPKSTLAMKMEATYTDWDFDTVWAIDESEENPINNGYPYLRAFYEDIANPITISSLSVVNGNIVIDTKITDASDEYTLHIVLYDAEDKLCGYLVIPNERQLKDVFVVSPDIENAAYAKIFTWYSTDNIEPVSTFETLTIER